jgi:hypothetical protein
MRYMIDEGDSSNPHYKHVQATATLGSEVVFEEIINEPSMKGPFGKSCDQFKFDLNLVPKQDETLLDSTPEIQPEHGETTEMSFPTTSSSVTEEEEKREHLESVEHLEHTTPPSNPNSSNDMEMSTKAHSSSQSLLRHFMSPKFQFFNVSKSHILLKASRIDAHKVTNLRTIVLRRSFKASKLAT